MYPALNPATAGSGMKLQDFCELAGNAGFEGVEFDIAQVAQIIREQSIDAAMDLFESNNLEAASFFLPVDWRNDEPTWRKGLEALPDLAMAARAIGCYRTCTWIMPRSEVPYEENWKFHVYRLRSIGQMLKDHGIKLGLEFVGPKTMRTGPYDFIHTLDEALQLAHDASCSGVLLDSFHWFTSHLTTKDILKLDPNQIIHVHINDAPNKAPDEQLDNVRLLPGEGIIDLVGFLRTLNKVGYDGPVAVETFDEDLRNMSPEEAAAKAYAAIDKVWDESGIEF